MDNKRVWKFGLIQYNAINCWFLFYAFVQINDGCKKKIKFNIDKIFTRREREREGKEMRESNVTSEKNFLRFIASRIKVKSCHVCSHPLGIC